MKAKFIILIIAVATSTIVACSQKNVTEAEEPITDGQTGVFENTAEAIMLPSFTMMDSNGNVVSLQSLKGKKVFINLWASWCPPCRREMPSIEKLRKSLDSNKVAFVMLSLDDNFDKAKTFIKRQKLSLPIYYPAENLPALFNVQGIPTTFIFDEAGNLLQRVDGGDEYNTEAYRKLLQ